MYTDAAETNLLSGSQLSEPEADTRKQAGFRVLQKFEACDARPDFDVHRELLNDAMVCGTYSFGLLGDLILAGRVWKSDTFRILYELACLEGIRDSSATKPAEPLGGELEGYWIKQYSQPRVVASRLTEMLKGKAVKKSPVPSNRRALLPSALNDCAYRRVADNDHRPKTDESIIYSRVGLINHYITIARHHEDRAQVRARIEQHLKADESLQWDCRTSILTFHPVKFNSRSGDRS